MSTTSMLRACAAGLVVSAASAALAQPQSVEDVRRQIESLQQQLQKLEQTDQEDRRVTELGGRRVRDRDPEQVVRLYDLGDLFALAPSYPARAPGDLGGNQVPLFPGASAGAQSGGGFGGGGGFFRVDRPETLDPSLPRQLHQEGSMSGGAGGPRTSIDDLIQAITGTIAPESWNEVGGPASIATLGTTLVISADRQSHEQIEGLLELFRQKWRTLRTVSLRAWWLWLDDAQLDGLLAAEVAPADAENGTDEAAFGLVEDAAWHELIENLPQAPDAGYRAAVTCYNGQTVHAVSGGQSLAVTGIEPVVGDAQTGEARPPVAYRPQVSVVDEGTALQVTPLASQSGKYVVLDVHSRVALTREGGGAAVDPAAEVGRRVAGVAPRDVVAALDRPAIAVQRLSTTLRVPVERTMLIGGMTFDGQDGGPATLYLFVRVAVQELRDDLPAEASAEEAPTEIPVDSPEESTGEKSDAGESPAEQ